MPTSLKEDFVAGQAPGLTWGNTVASILNDYTSRVYNVREYGAVGDGTTDDTVAVFNAIAAANNAGGGRVYFPRATYLVDAINLKPNIHLDLDQATIKKRVDGGVVSTVNTNSFIRTVETLSNGSYYGTYKNVRITGGFLDTNGKTCPSGMVRAYFNENLIIDGVTITSHATATWAFALGGRNGVIRNCHLRGSPTALFQDGIHVTHGSHWRIEGNDIHSGDDAIALGSEPIDQYLGAEPEPLRYVAIANNVVKSEKGYGLKVYTQSETGTDYKVTDFSCVGLVGLTGTSRNGGIYIIDQSTAGGQITRGNISNVSLRLSTGTHDGVNKISIYVDGTAAPPTRITFANCMFERPESGWTDYVGTANADIVRQNVYYIDR